MQPNAHKISCACISYDSYTLVQYFVFPLTWQVSVLNFDLIGVNAVLQVSNKDMVLRATVSEVGKEEKGDEDFTKYMNKLDSGMWNINPVNSLNAMVEPSRKSVLKSHTRRFSQRRAGRLPCNSRKDSVTAMR